MNLDLEALNQTLKNTLAETLGMKITEYSPGRIVMTMPVETRALQPMKLLHGGASVALAETAASMAGWLLVADQGKVVVGQEINANHLRPVTSGIVTAIGEIIHTGKASQVWEIKIYTDTQKLACISRCTLAVIPAPV